LSNNANDADNANDAVNDDANDANDAMMPMMTMMIVLLAACPLTGPLTSYVEMYQGTLVRFFYRLRLSQPYPSTRPDIWTDFDIFLPVPRYGMFRLTSAWSTMLHLSVDPAFGFPP